MNLDGAREAFRAAEAEAAFWREHHAALLDEYPDRFVAVSRTTRRVVATDPDLFFVVDKIEAKGLTVQDVWVKYLAATPQRWAL